MIKGVREALVMKGLEEGYSKKFLGILTLGPIGGF